jgi:hypothetical protein
VRGWLPGASDRPPARSRVTLCLQRRGQEASMMSGPEGEMAARAADRGRLRASHSDRNRVVDVLKAAFIEGRLTRDELDARLSQTLAARTYAELAELTADIPPGTKLARHPRPDRAPAPQSTRWVAHQAVKSGAATIGGLALALSVLAMLAGQPAMGVILAGFIVMLAAVAAALVGSLVGATPMIESRRRRKALPATVPGAARILALAFQLRQGDYLGEVGVQ